MESAESKMAKQSNAKWMKKNGAAWNKFVKSQQKLLDLCLCDIEDTISLNESLITPPDRAKMLKSYDKYVKAMKVIRKLFNERTK